MSVFKYCHRSLFNDQNVRLPTCYICISNPVNCFVKHLYMLTYMFFIDVGMHSSGQVQVHLVHTPNFSCRPSCSLVYVFYECFLCYFLFFLGYGSFFLVVFVHGLLSLVTFHDFAFPQRLCNLGFDHSIYALVNLMSRSSMSALHIYALYDNGKTSYNIPTITKVVKYRNH